MAIVNYRIDHVPQIHLPYRVIRYGGIRRDSVVGSFELPGDAEDVLDICRQEAEEVKQIERTDTLNDVRRMIYTMLPELDSCREVARYEDVSLSGAIEEIKRRLR